VLLARWCSPDPPSPQFADEVDFSPEDVENIVKNAIDTTLKDASYNPKKVNDWTNTVVDGCLKGLQTLQRPFKYIVTCIICQKNGAGMNTAATCFWDTNKDGHCKYPWENSTMHCIVTVFGMAINIEANTDLD
jgi:dynein light chain Tctex-type 1